MGLLDAAYSERGMVVIAFAKVMQQAGFKVGQLVDPAAPEWPVLLIDTPHGQVSWHFRAEEMPADVPPYDGVWDGHTTPEKYERLAALSFV